jgi:hypothetical protein
MPYLPSKMALGTTEKWSYQDKGVDRVGSLTHLPYASCIMVTSPTKLQTRQTMNDLRISHYAQWSHQAPLQKGAVPRQVQLCGTAELGQQISRCWPLGQL